MAMKSSAMCSYSSSLLNSAAILPSSFLSPSARPRLPPAHAPVVHDLEEEKEAIENPVPMALEQPEARPSEEDQMEEVEMEDISDEHEQGPIMDIDSSDAKNPLAVVDYVADMYAYNKKSRD